MKSDHTSNVLKSNILENKKIVISGTFENVSREELKSIIETNGGKNVSSVSKATDILIAGGNMGPSKLEKAKEFNISIMKENDFLSLINYNEKSSDSNQYKQGQLF